MNLMLKVGLEIHMQLKQEAKMFSRENTHAREENTSISAENLGLPGSLPSLNIKAVKSAILLAKACASTLAEELVFDRKHYFYADTAKNYQITQKRKPLGCGGHLKYIHNKKLHEIRLMEMHLEEDAAKSLNRKAENLLDFNRGGVALLEIVTHADISSAEQASDIFRALRDAARFLNISEGKMEEGQMRCDANISLYDEWGHHYPKSEIKNINSFRNLKKAIEKEYQIQKERIHFGHPQESLTKDYDASKDELIVLRKKEAGSYRYIPEPNLPPLKLDLNAIEKPQMPAEIYQELREKYKITHESAMTLSTGQDKFALFQQIRKLWKKEQLARYAHYICAFDDQKLKELSVQNKKKLAQQLCACIGLFEQNKISKGNLRDKLLPVLMDNLEGKPEEIARKNHWFIEMEAAEISEIIDDVLAEHPREFLRYRNGENFLASFFMGQIMKKSRGKADPGEAMQLLENKLKH